MKGYLQKYLIRTFLIGFGFIVLLTAAINIFLSTFTGKIEHKLTNYLNQRISIAGSEFLPPNFIILREVSVFKDSPSEKSPFFSIKKLKLTFSLSKLISKRNLVLSHIYFQKPRVNHFDIKDSPEQIIPLMNVLSKGQIINCTIEEGLLCFKEEAKSISCITINTALKIKGARLISSGSAGFTAPFKLEPITYSFIASSTKEGLTIENLEFKRTGVYAKFWGSMERGYLKLSGFSFLKDIYGDYFSQFNIVDRVKALIDRRRGPFKNIARLSGDVDLIEIDCLIKLGFPRLKIENLSFSLNNLPVCVQGDAYLSYPASINLIFPLQNIEADLRKLSIYFHEENSFNIGVQEADLSYRRNVKLHKISLKDFAGAFIPVRNRLIDVKFNAAIYDGSLEGEGQINARRMPFKSAFHLKIKDVSTDRLKFLSSYFANVSGKLESQIHYRNYPALNLNGEMTLRKGYLNEVKFFKWLAGFFNIPTLEKVDFDRLSTTFLVNDEAATLDRISLDSEDVTLSGYFNLQKNNLVSSRLCLGLSRKMVGTSREFRPLLKLLDKDLSYLSFDFQLSGLFQSLNIKWLDSDFKRKLQEAIPGSMERDLEKQIDEIIASISEE